MSEKQFEKLSYISAARQNLFGRTLLSVDRKVSGLCAG
ncbi:Uncharacterized protein dnm_018770 [Desulfonema magnum]|uniref:Uncharacterized protein n=1 Tax=Desulfonema magnum TaxID=45655 RepID=A0A975BI77_9BACT|nr:Uncharacterized protein dnm_018770 [Desulfonema magnum]